MWSWSRKRASASRISSSNKSPIVLTSKFSPTPGILALLVAVMGKTYASALGPRRNLWALSSRLRIPFIISISISRTLMSIVCCSSLLGARFLLISLTRSFLYCIASLSTSFRRSGCSAFFNLLFSSMRILIRNFLRLRLLYSRPLAFNISRPSGVLLVLARCFLTRSIVAIAIFLPAGFILHSLLRFILEASDTLRLRRNMNATDYNREFEIRRESISCTER
mmetsp:Transcript_5438/g.11820  ORF Transcript_5438/g.11820 Transcript_5438/m.11820 type:complete len:223 (-) Transcript_5438:21-689(-)